MIRSERRPTTEYHTANFMVVSTAKVNSVNMAVYTYMHSNCVITKFSLLLKLKLVHVTKCRSFKYKLNIFVISLQRTENFN